MGATLIAELFDGRGLDLTETAERKYTRRFKVSVDTKAEGPIAALAASGLPVRGDAYACGSESDAGAFCKSIKVSPIKGDGEGNTQLYLVSCDYSSKFDPEAYPENPLLARPQRRWVFNKEQIAIDKDIDGELIKNKAGDVFVDPPVTRDLSRLQFEFQRNEALFDVALALEYQDAINNDAFLGADPYQVKCQSIQAQDAYENGVYYYQVTYVFEFNAAGWRASVLNRGYRYKVNATDKVGTTTQEQVLLANDGTKLASNGTPVFLELKVYPEKPFAAFNIT